MERDTPGNRECAPVDREAILGALERMLAAPGLRGSKRLGRFLRFVVERKLEGREDEIKEYVIATDVYGKGPNYDPQFDSLVRVEASRLRARIRDYYQGEGRDEPVRILLPRGRYVPSFGGPDAQPSQANMQALPRAAETDDPHHGRLESVRPEPACPEPGRTIGAPAAVALDSAPADSAAADSASAAQGSRRTGGLVLSVVAVAILAAVAWRVSSPSEPEAPQRFRFTPITSDPGSEVSAAISPDGSQVAFARIRLGEVNADIYVQRLDADSPLRLTSDLAVESSPVWSPDGSRIAFLRDAGEGRSKLVLIPALGGAERVLAELRTQPSGGVTWSPDGSSIVAVERIDDSGASFPQLTAVDPSSGRRRALKASLVSRLAEAYSPAYSPDGSQIAFLGSRGSWPADVYLAQVDEPGIRRIAALKGRGDGVAWTRDGTELLVGRFTPLRARALWRIRTEDGATSELQLGENPAQPSVSADGSLLAFSERTSVYNIVRYHAQQPPEAADDRFIDSTRFDGNPQYSSDGTRIAFSSARSGRMEIWSCKADGTGARPLTSIGLAGSPRWSPDDRWIAFDSTADGDADVYVVGAQGGAARKLTDSSAEDALPSWSVDGEWIFFTSNRNGSRQLWRLRLDQEQGAVPELVTRDGGFYSAASPDGKWLYYARERASKSSLWRMELPRGEPEPTSVVLNSGWGNWQPVPGGVYYVAERPEREPPQRSTWEVRFYDQETGTTEARFDLSTPSLPRLPTLAGPGFSISPDEQWILSGQISRTSDLMLLENFR